MWSFISRTAFCTIAVASLMAALYSPSSCAISKPESWWASLSGLWRCVWDPCEFWCPCSRACARSDGRPALLNTWSVAVYKTDAIHPQEPQKTQYKTKSVLSTIITYQCKMSAHTLSPSTIKQISCQVWRSPHLMFSKYISRPKTRDIEFSSIE